MGFNDIDVVSKKKKTDENYIIEYRSAFE